MLTVGLDHVASGAKATECFVMLYVRARSIGGWVVVVPLRTRLALMRPLTEPTPLAAIRTMFKFPCWGSIRLGSTDTTVWRELLTLPAQVPWDVLVIDSLRNGMVLPSIVTTKIRGCEAMVPLCGNNQGPVIE
jgi:hypothetical protein